MKGELVENARLADDCHQVLECDPRDVLALYDRIEQLQRENADLKHDLRRYMKIANIECNESEALRCASLTADEGAVAELKSMADALRNGGFLKLHAGALPYLDAAIAALQKEPPHEGC